MKKIKLQVGERKYVATERMEDKMRNQNWDMHSDATRFTDWDERTMLWNFFGGHEQATAQVRQEKNIVKKRGATRKNEIFNGS